MVDVSVNHIRPIGTDRPDDLNPAAVTFFFRLFLLLCVLR